MLKKEHHGLVLWLSKLVDGLSLCEFDEMGKQRKTRKRKNNATDTLPIAGLSFGI